MRFYNIITVVLVFTSFFKMNAQNGIVFGLDKDYTKRHIKKNNDNPFVYLVNKKKTVLEEGTIWKKKSLEYEELQEKINAIENDTLGLDLGYENDVRKYDSLKIAVNNINSFLNSQKPIEASRNILIESQEIITYFNINELVYADHSVNSSQKTKFLLLSSNYTNLRLHLKGVVDQITSINVAPEEGQGAPDESILAEMKEELKNMKPYTIVKGPKKKRTITSLVLANKVNSIHTELKGDFVVVNNYMILNKDFNKEFKKGSLIDVSLARKKDLISKGYVSASSKKLIKNTSSKKTYVVDNDFLKKYAFTFNGKFRYQAKNLISSL